MAARQGDTPPPPQASSADATASPPPPYAGPTFKSSRIKRLMQRDEDVGKIATATPVLVARALECLMTDVLKAAADVAVDRNTKTVTPAHLKDAIDTHDHFDFLRPTVAAVPSLEDADAAKAKVRKPKAKRPRTASMPRASGGRKKTKPIAADAPKDVDLVPLQPTAAAAAPPVHELPSVSIDSIRSAANDEEDDYDEDDDDGNTADTECAAEPVSKPEPQPLPSLPLPKDGPSEPCDSSSRVSVQALLS